MDTLTFLLVDDSASYRQILRQMVDTHPRWSIAAEASDGLEATRLATEYTPAVVLMDVSLPTLNGIEATRRIKRTAPEIRVIIFSGHRNKGFQRASLLAGADAFFWKEELDRPILETLIEQWFSVR